MRRLLFINMLIYWFVSFVMLIAGELPLEAQHIYFQGPFIYGAGTIPEDLTVADFNLDGLLDFAVGNTNIQESNGIADEVSVFLGIGGGNFTAQSIFEVGGAPEGITAGFLDSDACVDLATANFLSSTVSVLLGVPQQPSGCTGGFITGATIDMSISGFPLSPRGIFAGDFNGDGIDDLATANQDDDSVSILHGNGDGTFTAVGDPIPVGIGPETIITANLNGDAFLDLVTADYFGNSVSILHGHADGTFSFFQTVAVGIEPKFVKAVDLNNDGFDDILSANVNASDSTVSVLRNDAGTGYTAMPPLTAPGAKGPLYINAADLNNDGNMDVVVSFQYTNMIAFFPGLGDFSFLPPQIIPQDAAPYGIGIADFNNDSRLDLVISNTFPSNIYVYLGTEPGPVTFLGQDTITQGTWSPTYGSDGYVLLNGNGVGSDIVQLPGYIDSYTFSATAKDWVWSADTTDASALMKPGGNRVAATKFSEDAFSLTLNATDATPHVLALYVLDWDSVTRQQTIAIHDVATNAVLDQLAVTNFHNGVYLTYLVQGSIRIEITHIAGANAVLSGIFWSPAPLSLPGEASNPTPTDLATGVGITPLLTWTPGADTSSHDVYFGTSSPGVLQDNQSSTTFSPGSLAYNTTYYWRIDEVNSFGTTPGEVWGFTTAPSSSSLFADGFESGDTSAWSAVVP